MKKNRMIECELRSAQEEKDMILEGYALKFNEKTELWKNFFEVIEKGALDGADMEDVVMVFNHDFNQLLAGTRNGSLSLRVDDTGLKIRAKLIDTQASRDIYKLAESGLLSKMSFSFALDEDGEEVEKVSDGVYLNHIKKISRLWDVSPVTFPAYEQTELYAKSKQGDEKTILKMQKKEMEELLSARN